MQVKYGASEVFYPIQITLETAPELEAFRTIFGSWARGGGWQQPDTQVKGVTTDLVISMLEKLDYFLGRTDASSGS